MPLVSSALLRPTTTMTERRWQRCRQRAESRERASSGRKKKKMEEEEEGAALKLGFFFFFFGVFSSLQTLPRAVWPVSMQHTPHFARCSKKKSKQDLAVRSYSKIDLSEQ
jgi:hypothetical protein